MKKTGQAHQGGASFSATEAQNNFGRVLERASADGVVFITRHQRPQAVVLSVNRYEELTRTERPDLDALTREYDGMMERMQSAEAAAGYDALFSASEEALGAAAVRGAEKIQDLPRSVAARRSRKPATAKGRGSKATAASGGAAGSGSETVKAPARRKRA